MPATIFQVVGYKNSGKTTLIERLVGKCSEHGYRVGTIKHDAHHFETDHPGTDTWRHRKAGAKITAITSAHRTAIIEERYTPLEELIHKMEEMELIIVEGFKHEAYPKIVMLKNAGDDALLNRLSHVHAVVSWQGNYNGECTAFALNDIEGLFEWMINKHKLFQGRS